MPEHLQEGVCVLSVALNIFLSFVSGAREEKRLEITDFSGMWGCLRFLFSRVIRSLNLAGWPLFTKPCCLIIINLLHS